MGPYEVINKMDYGVNMDGKDKVFHANLLRRYFERAHTRAAAVTVIDEDDSIGDGVVNENSLLHLPTQESREIQGCADH